MDCCSKQQVSVIVVWTQYLTLEVGPRLGAFRPTGATVQPLKIFYARYSGSSFTLHSDGDAGT